MSFFSIRNYADEFIPVVAGNQVATEPAEDADDIAEIAAGIEEQTGDFIIKRLAKELKGHPFARFVGSLLQAMGFFTRVSDEGPDGGIDIVAHRDELGFEPPIIKVQVKSGEGTIGDPEVSALYGKVGHGEFGMFITIGLFSRPARNFAHEVEPSFGGRSRTRRANPSPLRLAGCQVQGTTSSEAGLYPATG